MWLVIGAYTKDKPTRCWPSGKIRYRDRKDAKRARRARQAKGAGYLRIYSCPHCKGMHLTSQYPDRLQANREDTP